jgi:hypothetical protein
VCETCSFYFCDLMSDLNHAASKKLEG